MTLYKTCSLIQNLHFDISTLHLFLKHCPNLKAISRHGVGIDNVDLNYIKNNKISLLITATANAVAVAEHVLSMFLCLSKSIMTDPDSFCLKIDCYLTVIQDYL